MGQRYNFYATYKFLSPLYLSGEPSSWNTYFARISDGLIRRQTDALVSTGLSRVGYRYVNIDDGFFAGRDAKGNLLINTSKFPGGLKPVVEYIMARGSRPVSTLMPGTTPAPRSTMASREESVPAYTSTRHRTAVCILIR